MSLRELLFYGPDLVLTKSQTFEAMAKRLPKYRSPWILWQQNKQTHEEAHPERLRHELTRPPGPRPMPPSPQQDERLQHPGILDTGLAPELDQAKLHALFIAHVLGPYDVYKRPANIDRVLASGAQFPIHDPLYLVPSMAAATRNLSFGITASTHTLSSTGLSIGILILQVPDHGWGRTNTAIYWTAVL